MKYTGPLGKQFSGDKAKAMSLQGAARLLVQQTFDRLKAPPFNGRGYLVQHKQLADGSWLHAMVNMIGAQPVIRTWIESPSSARDVSPVVGRYINLIYVVFNSTENYFDVFEVTVDKLSGGEGGGYLNTLYAVDDDVLYDFDLDFETHQTSEPDLRVGAGYWESSGFALSWFGPKIFCNGRIVHVHPDETASISAAAIDFKERPTPHIKQRTIGHVVGAMPHWAGSGISTPGEVRFTEDARHLLMFAYSNMLYWGYTVGVPHNVGERNGKATIYNIRKTDSEGNLQSLTLDSLDYDDLIERTEVSEGGVTTKTEHYTLLADVRLYKITGDQAQGSKATMDIDTLSVATTETFSDYSITTTEITTTLTYLGVEHVIAQATNVATTSNSGMEPYHTTRSGSVFYVALDGECTLMRLFDWTREDGTDTEEVITATKNFALWSPYISGTSSDVGPSGLDFSLEYPDPDALFRPTVVFGVSWTMRNIISDLFLFPTQAVWATPPSPHAPVFRRKVVDEANKLFAVIPYGWQMTYVTDFNNQMRLNSEQYYAGVSSGTPVRFVTAAGRKAEASS